jgi:hypothetical protein
MNCEILWLLVHFGGCTLASSAKPNICTLFCNLAVYELNQWYPFTIYLLFTMNVLVFYLYIHEGPPLLFMDNLLQIIRGTSLFDFLQIHLSLYLSRATSRTNHNGPKFHVFFFVIKKLWPSVGDWQRDSLTQNLIPRVFIQSPFSPQSPMPAIQ